LASFDRSPLTSRQADLGLGSPPGKLFFGGKSCKSIIAPFDVRLSRAGDEGGMEQESRGWILS
jgi:hypothetical protein